MSEKDQGIGVSGLTVGRLIRQWLHPSDDPWHLALVQRDRVWNPLRVARLLDSLLAGYPIGTLLLVRLEQDSHVLSEDRRPVPAPPGTWQLLDGQQRINALVAMFSDQAGGERYYLDMFGSRWWDEKVVTQTRGQAAATSYITYRRSDEEARTWNPIPGRTGFLCLAGLSSWAGEGDEAVRGALAALRTARSSADASGSLRDTLRFLAHIDPQFQGVESVSDRGLIDIAERAEQLLEVWLRSIPVERAELATEQDVLQVFERVNLEGVRVAGDDVFFAAIKTRWPDAEPRLRSVTDGTRVLDRLSGLRVLSRLAALADGQADLLPLRVDRLNGQRGDAIRIRLGALSDPEGRVLGRMTRVGAALVERSGLGFGLRLIPRSLFDPVLAWAATSARFDAEEIGDDEIGEIGVFLVGATVFRYPSVFDDAWARLTLQLALGAGIDGRPFPTSSIIEETRRMWPEARVGRRSVPRIDGPGDRLRLGNDNIALLLAIAQNLPFVLPPRTRLGVPLPGAQHREVEWDHIWPANLQTRMRFARRLVDGSDRVHHLGNFWALDRPLNNYVRDRPPSTKFPLLADPTSIAHLPDRWPMESHGLLETWEIAELEGIEGDLFAAGRTDVSIRSATARFAALVDRRTARVMDAVTSRYPGLASFAPGPVPDAPSEEPDGATVDAAAIAAALHLPVPTRLLPAPTTQPGADGLGAIFGAAASADLADDLRLMLGGLRAAGFRTVGYRPRGDPTPRWIKVGVDTPGARQGVLFWIVPEPERRTLRVQIAQKGLRWLLGLAPEESYRLFSTTLDREFAQGEAGAFLADIVEPLRVRLASVTVPAGPYE